MPTYTASDGAELHYDELGDGPVLLALAGGAGRHRSYLDDLAGLAERHRLIIPHLRALDYWALTADVEALRRHLRIPRLRVLAHSAGTRLAMAWAVRFPARVAALILVTPPAEDLVDVPSDKGEMTARRSAEPWFADALAAAESGPETPGDEGINAFLARVAPLGYAHWGEAERAHAGRGPIDAAANQAFGTLRAPAELAARLSSVTAPVLVVAGADDCLTGLAPVLALGDRFPKSTVAVIDDCGHYPWVEQPAAFREAVENFLEP